MESAVLQLIEAIFKQANGANAKEIGLAIAPAPASPPDSPLAGLGMEEGQVVLDISYDGEEGVKSPGPYAQAVMHALFVKAEINPWEKGALSGTLTDAAGNAWQLSTSEDQQSMTLVRVLARN